MKKPTPFLVAQFLLLFLLLPASYNAAGTVQYSYDNNGRLISEKYPDGREILYTYDAMGNFVSRTVEYSIIWGDVAPRGGPDGEVRFNDAQYALSLSISIWTPTAAEIEKADVTPYESFDTGVSPWVAVVGDGTGGKPDGAITFTDAQSILAASLGLLVYEGS